MMRGDAGLGLLCLTVSGGGVYRSDFLRRLGENRGVPQGTGGSSSASSDGWGLALRFDFGPDGPDLPPSRNVIFGVDTSGSFFACLFPVGTLFTPFGSFLTGADAQLAGTTGVDAALLVDDGGICFRTGLAL
jgi:hypothetical protein